MVIYQRRLFQILTLATSFLMFTVLYTSNSDVKIFHNMNDSSSDEYTEDDSSTTPDNSDSRIPFKIFIYNLSSEFNTQFEPCAKHGSTNLNNSGFGAEVTRKRGEMAIMDTFQYATEVIIHQKLLASPYRTLDPDKADAFYIPYYITLQRAF